MLSKVVNGSQIDYFSQNQILHNSTSQLYSCEISGSHGGKFVDESLLGYSTM
jgi:hypothetical protein